MFLLVFTQKQSWLLHVQRLENLQIVTCICSILFYSILFYSILFYSILFYSSVLTASKAVKY